MTLEEVRAEIATLTERLAQLRHKEVWLVWRSQEPASLHGRMHDMALIVAEEHGVTLGDIRGPSRLRPHVYARHDFIWRVMQMTREDGSRRYSLAQVGRFLGDRDHSSIIHGRRGHEKRMREAIQDAA